MTGANNLDPGDTDLFFDIYVKDVLTGELTLASTTVSGEKGNGTSQTPSLSAEGTKVAFESLATNFGKAEGSSVTQVYVKDLVTGELLLASSTKGGVEGSGYSYAPSLPAGGSKVAFYSYASNLHPNDRDESPDIYVKDLTSGDLVLASTSDTGVKGNHYSFRPDLTADGEKVVFYSASNNLDPADTDPYYDIYLKDLANGNIVLISTSGAAANSNDNDFDPAVSADGKRVAFESWATNLLRADSDSIADIYVKELSL